MRSRPSLLHLLVLAGACTRDAGDVDSGSRAYAGGDAASVAIGDAAPVADASPALPRDAARMDADRPDAAEIGSRADAGADAAPMPAGDAAPPSDATLAHPLDAAAMEAGRSDVLPPDGAVTDATASDATAPDAAIPEVCNDEDLLNVCGTCAEVLVEYCNGLDDDCDGLADDRCCPSPSAWSRPGGFWSQWQGQGPNFVSVGDVADACNRGLSWDRGEDCLREDDGCEGFRRESWTYADGNLASETGRYDRFPLMLSDYRELDHNYDAAGHRTSTAFYFVCDLRCETGRGSFEYLNDAEGRLVEERMLLGDIDDENVPLLLVRVSRFVYGLAEVEEQIDADADGDVEMARRHPWPSPR